MRKNLIFYLRFFLAFLISMEPVFGATLRDQKKSQKGKYIIDTETISSSSSELLRENKTIYVLGGLGLIAAEVSVGWYLKPDLVVNATWVTQQDYLAGSAKLYLINFQWFPENSFYLSSGLGLREGMELNYINSLGKNKGSRRLFDRGTHVSIGNLWQWDYMTLGGEWISVYFPIWQSESSDLDIQLRVATLQIGFSF